MVNRERADEMVAKGVVESVLGVALAYADVNDGDVDYRSADGLVAVEVTRVTNGERKAARDALSTSRAASARPSVLLQSCWLVFLPDTQRGMNTVYQNLRPLFAQLEAAGVTYFDGDAAAVHVLQGGPLAGVYRQLRAAGVDRARMISHLGDAGHVHDVLLSPGSGGSAGGSDESVVLLSAVLSGRPDNVSKLAKSGASQRHLFVWVDDDTRFDIARPLSREAPAWAEADGSFGTPTRAPALDPAVTHLWVVHERSRRGWLWDGPTGRT